MLPSHKHFRGKDLRITDPIEIDFAESKLIHLAQMEFFPVELKTLTAGKPIKNSSNIGNILAIYRSRWNHPFHRTDRALGEYRV